MKKYWLILFLILVGSGTVSAQERKGVSMELESLVPMYLFGGAHIAVSLNVDNFRFRASCIDGGNYDFEPNNETFERNLGVGCGVFAGTFLNDNWHIYLFVERQRYIVTKRDSLVQATFDVWDVGPGIGYQYFIWDETYIQPALHLYYRSSQTKQIDGIDYSLRNLDLSAVFRVGYRFHW